MTRTDENDDDDDEKDDDGLKEEKFHLYILSGNSKMYFFIRCASNNFIIVRISIVSLNILIINQMDILLCVTLCIHLK